MHQQQQVKMDPVNSTNKDDASVQARARRRRNDQSSRDYTCGCGKSYLSYPALYTHLKQKHQGSPPQGIIWPIKMMAPLLTKI